MRSASSSSTISPRSSRPSRSFHRFSVEECEELVARPLAVPARNLAGAARILARDGVQQRAMLGDDRIDAPRTEAEANAQRLDEQAAATQHAQCFGVIGGAIDRIVQAQVGGDDGE